VNKFKGNLDHFLRENREFKLVLLTLSSLEPFALSNLLIWMKDAMAGVVAP